MEISFQKLVNRLIRIWGFGSLIPVILLLMMLFGRMQNERGIVVLWILTLIVPLPAFLMFLSSRMKVFQHQAIEKFYANTAVVVSLVYLLSLNLVVLFLPAMLEKAALAADISLIENPGEGYKEITMGGVMLTVYPYLIIPSVLLFLAAIWGYTRIISGKKLENMEKKLNLIGDDFRQRMEALIGEGEFDQVFETLKPVIQTHQPDIYNDLIIVRQKWSRLKKNELTQILDSRDADRIYAEISKALLSFVRALPENTPAAQS